MLLDIAKLLFDKNTRESFREIVEYLKKKPEWKKDLIELDERFTRPDESKARLFVQFSAELLTQKGWQSNRVGAAEFAMQEIVDNAFTHGLGSDNDAKLRIRTLLSSAWVRCRVTDSGNGFSLDEVLTTQTNGERRGLWKVKAIASKLVQDGPNTIEVTIERERQQIAVEEVDGLYVVSLDGSFRGDAAYFDSEFAKLVELVPSNAGIVIDLTETTYANSLTLRLLMRLQKRTAEKHGTAVLVTKPGSGVREVMEMGRLTRAFRTADTRSQALEALRTENAGSTSQSS